MTTTNLTFYGTDASNEISLLEYGLLVSKEEHEDNSGTHFVVYRYDESHFGCCHISEKEINGYVLGSEFPDKKEIASFLSFVGSTKEEWIELNMAMKLSDLISFWGYENILGTDYNPMTEEEAKERYLN